MSGHSFYLRPWACEKCGTRFESVSIPDPRVCPKGCPTTPDPIKLTPQQANRLRESGVDPAAVEAMIAERVRRASEPRNHHQDALDALWPESQYPRRPR